MDRNYTDKLRAQLKSLDKDKLLLLAKSLKMKGFHQKGVAELIETILKSHDEDRIRNALSDIRKAFEVQETSRWQRYHNHVYGFFTILGVLVGFVFYFWPSSPSIVVEENPMPTSIAIRTVDGSGNVLNETNTKLLEYVLYKEDKKRQWQYLQTSKTSNEEYTSLGISDAGIYNIEVYDFGMFLGVAADIVAKKDGVQVTINAPKKRLVKIKVVRDNNSMPQSNVEVQILTGKIQDQATQSKQTNEKGEVEFVLWPTLVPQEYYLIKVVEGRMELYTSQPIHIRAKEEPEVIFVKVGTDATGRERK